MTLPQTYPDPATTRVQEVNAAFDEVRGHGKRRKRYQRGIRRAAFYVGGHRQALFAESVFLGTQALSPRLGHKSMKSDTPTPPTLHGILLTRFAAMHAGNCILRNLWSPAGKGGLTLSNIDQGRRVLSPQYEEILVGSGLVQGVRDIAALKPVLRQLLEGETLCEAGDEADCLWVIARGALAATQDGATLVVRPAPAVFGEQGLIDAIGRRRARVVALNGLAEVLEIRKSAIDAHPDADLIWRNLAWIICRKLDEMTAESHSHRREIARLVRLLRLYVGEHALSEGKLTPKEAIEGPRSEMAVIWFSDIVGFSKFSTIMSPYQASNFTQQFLTPQVEIIDRLRGYVDKFIGDAVMAYWIVQSRSGAEECEAALAAALGVVDAISELALGAEPLRIRIGLHIGRVSIGNFGTRSRSQFTLIGPEVNKASRLESCGEEQIESGGPLGSIRASEEFYGSLSSQTQERLEVRVQVKAKNIGTLRVFTTTC